eukprot:6197073-Pleurochrysis_carterae.AAC.2
MLDAPPARLRPSPSSPRACRGRRAEPGAEKDARDARVTHAHASECTHAQVTRSTAHSFASKRAHRRALTSVSMLACSHAGRHSLRRACKQECTQADKDRQSRQPP